MKKKYLAALSIVTMLTIAACGGTRSSEEPNTSIVTSSETDSSSEGGNSSSSKSYGPIVEDYPITVPNVTGVTVVASAKRAVAGTRITFTVTLAAGYKLDKVEVPNARDLTKVSEGNYAFTMPERSVRINVSVSIDGDFVIAGDFSAELLQEGNMYVARNVAVPYNNNDYAQFSYIVQKNGQSTKLDSLALDETRCFANVFFNTGGDHKMRIATGCTYDFYYDATDAERPCYVIRKSVDKIPSTGDALFTRVFDGRMRSEPTLHAPDLKAIDYTYDDGSLKYSYNYKRYANSSLATILDTSNETAENFYVYKHADWTNNVYEVVNTWSKDKGNNENEYALWELDPYGDWMNSTKTHQPFSARLDITPDETDTRLEISQRDVKRNIAMGAHYGAELEYEFYDAYRSVFSGNVIINPPSAIDPGYSVQANSDGSFTATINSMVEYNRDETSGTADVTDHSGHTNNLVLDFAKNGALKTMTWTRRDYSQSQWNFIDHQPKIVDDCKAKRITCTNTYGEVYSGEPTFNASQYFISNISKASWYNADNTDGKSATVSNVCFGDELEFYPYGGAGKKAAIVDEFTYTPATALDMWQYGIASSNDTSVVGLNGQNRYEVLNVGETTVTISNRTANSASITKNISVKSQATACAHQFFINANVAGYDSTGCDNANLLVAKAGKTSTYYVDVSAETGKKAPCSYRLAFRSDTKDEFGNYTYTGTSKYLTYTTQGHVLTLNCNTPDSMALDKAISIEVKVLSDYYAPNWGPETWTITLLPSTGNDDIVGSHWICTYVDEDTGAPTEDQTDVYFYDRQYEGYSNIFVGKITDYIVLGNNAYENTFHFIYQVNNMGIIVGARVTSIEVEHPAFVGTSAANYYLYFDNVTDLVNLGVCMWWETGDGDYQDIFGYGYMLDDEQVAQIEYYQSFQRV